MTKHIPESKIALNPVVINDSKRGVKNQQLTKEEAFEELKRRIMSRHDTMYDIETRIDHPIIKRRLLFKWIRELRGEHS